MKFSTRISAAFTAAALVSAGAVVVTAAPAEAATAPLTFAEYNLCGNVCWSPVSSGNPYPGKDTRGEVSIRTKRVVSAVDYNRPDIIALNESCYSQYRAIRAKLLA